MQLFVFLKLAYFSTVTHAHGGRLQLLSTTPSRQQNIAVCLHSTKSIEMEVWTTCPVHSCCMAAKQTGVKYTGPLCCSRSFKVTDFGTIRKPICDFLLVINTHLLHILHRFQAMADYWSYFC